MYILLVLDLPKFSIFKLVFRLKGTSSMLIRKRKYPTVRAKLWGNALWSSSYFASSCGGAPISIIRQYIDQQKRRIKNTSSSFDDLRPKGRGLAADLFL